MDGWDKVSAWAAASYDMAKAINDASNKVIIGMPYGIDGSSRLFSMSLMSM